MKKLIFSEAEDPTALPAIAAVVRDGSFCNVQEHYEDYGKYEKRLSYLQNQITENI